MTAATPLDVRLITCRKYPGGDPETRALAAFIAAHGIGVEVLPWDADIDWSTCRLTILRSTWDYHLRIDEFLRWIDRTASVTSLWNRPRLVRWNTHKRYLLDLERAGVPIVPTVLVSRGDRTHVTETLATKGWHDVVAKPAVSLDGEGTVRLAVTDEHALDRLTRMVDRTDLLLQPFVPSVATDGETSVVCIDADITHAVKKSAAPGEFRVQQRYGGSTIATTAPPEALALARRILDVLPEQPMYARVDMVRVEDGFCLSELELVEPSLYLKTAPATRVRFLEAVRSRLDRC